jgi:enoyl-CoA hydratase/carnithine racemase
MATVSKQTLERRGSVAWVYIGDTQGQAEQGKYAATSVAEALNECRWDDSIRVVVLTGESEGQFYRLARRDHWDDERYRNRLSPMPRARAGGYSSGGFPTTHDTLLHIDKPVVARVNGDAIGNGASLLWLCDIVVAREDARIAWGFQGLGEIVDSDGDFRGMPWALTPSYGTPSFVFMPPTMVKEFVMLSRVFTAAELAEMRIFNYAVPMSEVDEIVERVVQQFLARPPYVLARTKRLINKHLVAQFDMVEDLAAAYSQLDLWQYVAEGEMK